MTFLAELRRRNVIRMAGWYVVGAWLIVQVASIVFPAFELPAWTLRGLILLMDIRHPLTDKGLEQFMKDWAKTGQKII